MLIRFGIAFFTASLLTAGTGAAEERAPLVTYGSEAPSREGDDDHVQTFILQVPDTVTGKVFVRLYDADCGGLLDTIYETPNTETRFSLYGGAATEGGARTRLASEAFGEDAALDNEWHTWAELDPSRGEARDGYTIFEMVVEGVSGNDGNAYDVALSTSDARNLTPDGTRILNDAPTLRLDSDGAAELRFSIPGDTDAVTVYNFDTAGARITFDTVHRSVRVASSAQGDLGETFVRLEANEAGGAAALTFYNDGGESPNDATLYVRDAEGSAIPIEIPILVERPNRRPSQKIATRPLADCRSIVFDGAESTDADGDLLSFFWDFGDGASGEGANVVHQYDRPGAYRAFVSVRDNSGRVGDSVLEALDVRVNQPPIARLSPHWTAAPGEPVTFDGSSSSDPEGGALRYVWNFGDGSDGEGERASHEYAAPGRYELSLRVEDDSGTPCNWHVAESEVWINAPPVAEAGTDRVASVGETIHLDGARSYDRDGELTEWVWDLGDGTKREGAAIDYVYREPGKYPITLEVRDDAGVDNSESVDRITVFVNAPPVAEAGEDRRVAVGEVSVFDASPSADADGHIVAYDWDFGDGNRGKGARVPYAFEAPGTYTVGLRVRDNSPAASGVGRDSLTVVVNAPPVANAGPDQTVTTSEVRFDGSGSFDPDGRLQHYAWDFGDGTTGEGAHSGHIYQRPGIFHASLKVTDDSGTASSESVDAITIVVNRRPAADAGPDRVVAPGEPASFAAFESFDSDGEIVGYTWDFGDGQTATGKAAKHAYADPGTYLVRLTVNDNTDDPRAVDYDESMVKVNAQPHANPGADVLAAPGETVRFDASASFDHDGAIASYEWYFGDDGAVFSEPVVEKSFAAPGIYTAKLRVTDDSGVANAQAEDEVTIHVNHEPQAVAGNDVYTCDGAITFDGSGSIDGDGDALTYQWDFGDSTSAFGEKVTHVFSEGGVYPVTLTVDDGTGLANARHSSSLVATINRAPTAAPGPDVTVCAGEVAVFDGSGSSDPDGGALRYRWDFGDGNTSDLMNPTKIYKTGGVYSATLEVEDTSALVCNADTSQVTVRVAESPTADAGADMSVCANTRVRFDGTESTDTDGVVNRFRWDFGDGATGGGPTPEHIFTQPGDYRVRLTVTGDLIGSCDNTDTNEILVQVREAPVVRIGGPDVVAIGTPVSFDASESVVAGANVVSWTWDLGGTELEGEKVSYTFEEAGSQTVTLTLTTDVVDACTTVSAQKAVVVNLPPVAEAGEDQLVGVDELVELSAMGSKDPDGAIVAYEWDFGDGNTATGVQVRHRYQNPGDYAVNLTVRDDTAVANNTQTDRVRISVNAAPSPEIDVASPACVATELAFSGARSFDRDGAIVGYRWSFGDGASAEGPEVAHTYARPGHYQVSLVVDDGTGVDTGVQNQSVTLQVNQPPIAQAGPERTVCAGDDVAFDGTKSVDRDGRIMAYRWLFGDESAADGDESGAAGAEVSHTFGSPGTYDVELAVVDDSGSQVCGAANDVVSVRVNAPPVAVVNARETLQTLYTGGAHDAVLFDATGSFDPDDDALVHLWDFGDGTKRTGAKVFHAYTEPGQYTIRLTVKDETGLACGEDTTELTVDVVERSSTENDR